MVTLGVIIVEVTTDMMILGKYKLVYEIFKKI
jgi:hypothetical protein